MSDRSTCGYEAQTEPSRNQPMSLGVSLIIIFYLWSSDDCSHVSVFNIPDHSLAVQSVGPGGNHFKIHDVSYYSHLISRYSINNYYKPDSQLPRQLNEINGVPLVGKLRVIVEIRPFRTCYISTLFLASVRFVFCFLAIFWMHYHCWVTTNAGHITQLSLCL